MKNKNKVETQKVKYNMWQNTGFMIRYAWKYARIVIFTCIAIAAVTASQTIAQLLVAPAILKKIESAAPLAQLLLTIALFGGILFVTAGLKEYLDVNVLTPRISVRTAILREIADKVAGTSYPNILDTDFINSEERAWIACSSNEKPVEQIWTTWTILLTNLIGFAAYLLLLSDLNPLLVGVVILTTVAGYFVNNHINEWGYRHRKEMEAYDKRLSYVSKIAKSREYAKDIRIFGLRNWMDEVWDKTMGLYQAFIGRREKAYLWSNVVDLVLSLLRNGIAYAYLIWLTLSQGLSASEFLLYFSAVSGFTQWITGILEQFSELHKESLEISILREFLEWPEPFQLEGGKHLPKDLDRDYEIRLENVTFRYPMAEKDTLSHIDLTIHPGEKLAVVGLNGAGKTTLVKLICGFLDPTEGRVLLNGEDIRGFNRKDYYALFSAVFQDFSLLEASAAENVAQQITDIDEDRVWACLDQAGLTEKFRSLPDGIHTKIGRQVYEEGIELSGGQTQRLMLARALYKNGPILTLDEPTAALDPIAENDIYMKYNEMTAGRTSLFISHRLASTRFCDRILFLENGGIAEEGTHEALLELNGGYAKLFEVQSQYYRKEGSQEGENQDGE